MSLEQALSIARARYGCIKPCSDDSHVKSWEECILDGYLWFNDEIGSTHIIKMEDTHELSR